MIGRLLATALLAFAMINPLRGDIFRWDNGEQIPGTEGITPGPGVQLDNINLEYANLSGLDLTGASFKDADLSHALLRRSTVTSAKFDGATLTWAVLHLQDGFTKEQLYSTASYQAKDLRGIEFGFNFGSAVGEGSDLTGWDFSGQDLRDASLATSILTDADFTGALVAGIDLQRTTSRGFTKEQLYSTDSYQTKNLQGITLEYNDLAEWDFAGQDLTSAVVGGRDFSGANLTNAEVEFASDLTGANLRTAWIDRSETTMFDPSTVYNQWTLFSFDPVAAGLTYMQSPEGDFDGDDDLDEHDVGLLAKRIRGESWRGYWPSELFDLNSDANVDSVDLRIWIHDLKQTYIGDANLDGQFSSNDLVAVFVAGQYEDGVPLNSDWAEGDWNGDGDFDTSDLVIAFTDGGYEQGPLIAANAVPESTSIAMLITGLIGVATVSRTRRSRI